MNRFYTKLTFALLVGTMVLMDSCLETVKSETDSMAAITKFSIGNFEVKTHDINANRRDTILYVKHGGAMYPMTIDQITNEIYNLDSVPKGALLSKVPSSTISATGYVYFRDRHSASYRQWQSGDTIDYTGRVQFRVVSTDGTYTRDYTVRVNVHTIYPDSMTWKKADDYNWSGMGAVANVAMGDRMYVLANDLGKFSVAVNDLRTGARVLESAVTGLPGYGWNSKLTAFAGRLYVTVGGTLYVSDDGVDWSVQATGIRSVMSPGSAVNTMWAVGTDGMIKTSNDMLTWTDFQAVPAEFPDSVANVVEYSLASNPGKTRLVAMGYPAKGNKVKVWTRLSTDAGWTQVETGHRTKEMPSVRSLSMFRYDGDLFACGDILMGFYESQDNGINWRFCDSYVEEYDSWNAFMQVPAQMLNNLGAVSCTVDSNNYIWIVNAYGALWKGIINRKMAGYKN